MSEPGSLGVQIDKPTTLTTNGLYSHYLDASKKREVTAGLVRDAAESFLYADGLSL